MKSPRLKEDSAKTYFTILVKDNSWIRWSLNNPLRDRLLEIHELGNRIFELDVAMWYGTLITAQGKMGTFLRRMLSTIYFGGLVYRSRDGNWKPWMETGTPLPSAISHGGRILIQLPKSDVKGAATFWEWMLAGVKPSKGGLATHGVDYAKKPYERLYSDRYKYLKETHGHLVAVTNLGHHYRLNIAMGGKGWWNPWTGKKISDNGEHGHLYMYYWKPTSKHYGAIMLSLESEAPHKTGQTGHKHTAKAGSEEFTATGGAKWVVKPQDKKKGFVEIVNSDLRDRYDGMFIDLVGDGSGRDIKFIKDNAQSLTLDHLMLMPAPPMTITRGRVFVPPPSSLTDTDLYLQEQKTLADRPKVKEKKGPPKIYGRNEVTFLLDGEEFFAALFDEIKNMRALLKKLKETVGMPPPNTYARLAFWGFRAGSKELEDAARGMKLPLTSISVGDKLVDELASLMEFGCQAEVILWHPLSLENLLPTTKEIAEFHKNTAGKLLEKSKKMKDVRYRTGSARVFLEHYEGWLGTSNHQKFAIFSFNGLRTAFVAGFNISPEYIDTIGHDYDVSGKNPQSRWHDTAIRLRGPAAVAVEKEWLRRWSRAIALQGSKNPGSNKHIYSLDGIRAANTAYNDTPQKMYGPGGVKKEELGVNRKELPRLQAHPGKVSLSAHKGVNVKIVVNRTEKTTRVSQIKDELLALIDRAKRYIYLENYALTDPDLVRALYTRKQKQRSLQIFVVTVPGDCELDGTPKKKEGKDGGKNGSGGWGENELSYLTRRSWLQLALRLPEMKGQKLWYRKKAGKGEQLIEVTRWEGITDAAPRGGATTSVVSTVKNRWLQDDRLVIHLPHGKKKKISFADIDRLYLPEKGGIYFYTPVRFTTWRAERVPIFRTVYVHSKLAIIDDRYVIVGSCNWTYRSLNYDGEMSACCANENLAKTVYRRLVEHYNYGKAPTPKLLHKHVIEENLNKVVKARTDKKVLAKVRERKKKLMLMPIEHPDFLWVRFQRVVPSSPLNFTWY
jgi:phosphatidylserine/phosphatidylglycerophosphate/cardiolipin synthase-like enzyme